MYRPAKTEFVEAEDVPEASEPGRIAAGWRKALVYEASAPLALLAAAGLPIAAALWLLLATPAVFSREMTWDFLYNLEGAWNLWNGLRLHVDVHDPLGIVPFGMTALGFRIVGLGPQAFLVGEAVYAALMLAAAICILPRRLPLAAAALATIYTVLLVLMPTNLGDPVETYSFAMSYNRLGWSALTLLFLVLFLAPQREGHPWLDQGIAFLLGTLLFYLKITYFGVAVGAIAAAFLLCPHIRRHAVAWLAVLGLVALIAAAPFNLAYWRDIFAAVGTGAVRHDALDQVKSMLGDGGETALVAVELLCLVWLGRAGGSINYVLSAVFIVACGLFILSQNEQSGDVPLYLLVTLLLYDGLRRAAEAPFGRRGSQPPLLLTAILIPPGIAIVSMMVSLAGYHEKAVATDQEMLVAESNLRGLAVPAETPDLITLFARHRVSPELLNAARLQHPRYELSQAEYLKTILEAAAIARNLHDLAPGPGDPQLMVLDSVNPLPFMLGLSPPRGGMLWYDRVFPWPPAEQALGTVDDIFVPRFPTDSAVTRMALRRYRAALARDFRRTLETDSWIVFARKDPAPEENLSAAPALR